MFPDVHRVGLSRIDTEDVTYRVSTERGDRLLESIGRLGLLQPVRLLDGNGPLVILSGFRRVAACRALGHTEIAARVYLEADLPARQRCLMAIGDNTTQRPINTVETARAVKLLFAQLADSTVVGECLKTLMLPDNAVWVDQQLALADLPPGLQRLLLEEVVGTAMALSLSALEPADGAALGRVFETLKLSLNRQREVLRLCSDLSRRDGRTIRQILEGPQLGALLENPEADIGVKTHGLRRQLKRLRYPGLVAAEADFHDCLKSLSLGQGIRLDPPPFFEGTTYKMTLSFSGTEELENLLEELKEKASSHHLSRILNRPAD